MVVNELMTVCSFNKCEKQRATGWSLPVDSKVPNRMGEVNKDFGHFYLILMGDGVGVTQCLQHI